MRVSADGPRPGRSERLAWPPMPDRRANRRPSAFFAIGAYTAAVLSLHGVPAVAALLAAPVLAAAVAAAVGIPILRLRGHYLAFATLAFQMIVLSVISNTAFLGGGLGFTAIPSLGIGGAVLSSSRGYAWLVWAVTAVAMAATLNLIRSRPGRALRALATSEVAAGAGRVFRRRPWHWSGRSSLLSACPQPRAAAPKAEQAQIPYISLSPVDQTVNPVQPYVFLVPAITTTYATRLMEWFKAEGITRIAVGYDNTDIYTTNGYYSTLSEAPAYGVKVVDTEVFQITTTNFSTIVSHVASSGAQAFLVWATGPAPVILTKTFAGAGLAARMKLVMTPSDATTLYTQPAGSAADGVIMAAAYGVIAPELPSSALKTEIEKLAVPFAAKYGGQPSEFAADAYSGAELLFAAAPAAGRDRPASAAATGRPGASAG
jgi:hypothetical protein